MTLPTLRCTLDAASPDSASTELVVLGASLGTRSELWSPALAELRSLPTGRSLRVLRFDLPGHGVSTVPSEPFTMSKLADAVIRLVEEAGGGRFHYAGVSISGAIGIELALRHSDRLLGLGIFCADARFGSAARWVERAGQVRTHGMPSQPSPQLWGDGLRPTLSPGIGLELVQLSENGPYCSCRCTVWRMLCLVRRATKQ